VTYINSNSMAIITLPHMDTNNIDISEY